MRLNKRAKSIQELLEHYIPDPQIPLKFDTPFKALIAVLLSAQCADERVNIITPKLFARAATPYEMMELTPLQIEAIIRPCGLGPQKSKAIHALSQILIDKHKGVVPSNMDALTALPGVGRKTASVILAQVFGIPAFPVDTHILRSANRWKLSKKKTPEGVEQDLSALFPPETWNRLHLQIILFARKYCPARGHITAHCPICTHLINSRA